MNNGKKLSGLQFSVFKSCLRRLTGGGTTVIDGFIIELFQNEIVKQNMSYRVKTIVT